MRCDSGLFWPQAWAASRAPLGWEFMASAETRGLRLPWCSRPRWVRSLQDAGVRSCDSQVVAKTPSTDGPMETDTDPHPARPGAPGSLTRTAPYPQMPTPRGRGRQRSPHPVWTRPSGQRQEPSPGLLALCHRHVSCWRLSPSPRQTATAARPLTQLQAGLETMKSPNVPGKSHQRRRLPQPRQKMLARSLRTRRGRRSLWRGLRARIPAGASVGVHALAGPGPRYLRAAQESRLQVGPALALGSSGCAAAGAPLKLEGRLCGVEFLRRLLWPSSTGADRDPWSADLMTLVVRQTRPLA